MPRHTSGPDNDGTNACAFLCVQLAHQLHKVHEKSQGGDSNSIWLEVCDIAEKVIVGYPRLINPHRDIGRFYDVMEAYKIMRNCDFMIEKYEFYEAIVSAEHIFSEKARMELLSSLSAMISKKEFCVGIYTCDPVIFVIGFMGNSIFILDTHSISEKVGGKAKGILKVFPYFEDEPDTCEGICYWIWQRLVSVAVPNTACQSLSIVQKISRVCG